MIIKSLKILQKIAGILVVVDAIAFFACYFFDLHEMVMTFFVCLSLNSFGHYAAKYMIKIAEGKMDE